jgi:hypothetical protein
MGLDRLLYIFPFKLCPTGDSISCSPNHEQGTLTKVLASQLRLSKSRQASLVSLLFMHLPSRYLASGSHRQSPDRQAWSALAESGRTLNNIFEYLNVYLSQFISLLPEHLPVHPFSCARTAKNINT